MSVRLLLATLVVLLVAAAPAAAAAGPCTPGGPRCTFWTGKVTFVADGDTIDVDLAGDGTRRPRRVRLTGINAMELTSYKRARRRGACHAVEATMRLEQLLRRGRLRVRLAAQDRASVTGGRLRRQVSTRIGGRWVDAGRAMVAEGHALWLPNGTEWAWNGRYADLSRLAAAMGVRLWDPRGCGPGPASDARISLRLNFDAEHNDRLNVDGEWVEISNGSAAPLPLAGWWFRDSALRRYTFPAAAVVPAGGRLTLRMGRGADGADTFHWGLPTPPFENPSYDERAVGDGGYLFDPRGNLRAWSIYN